MSEDCAQMIVPVVGLLVYVVVQVITQRTVRTTSLVRSMLTGYAAGLAVTAGCEVWVAAHFGARWPHTAALSFVNLCVYTGGAYSYFFFIALGVSLRIRMLRILAEAGGSLDRDSLAGRFDAQSLFDRRLQRLVESGQIGYDKQRYYSVRSAFLGIARLNALARRFYTGKE